MKAEIEKLKNAWHKDPCWDIEETEGFEAHRKELYQFRKKTEKEWKDAYTQKLIEHSVVIGVPGNLELTEYLLKQENTINNLNEKITKLEEPLT